jgi:hypothetical protein
MTVIKRQGFTDLIEDENGLHFDGYTITPADVIV